MKISPVCSYLLDRLKISSKLAIRILNNELDKNSLLYSFASLFLQLDSEMFCFCSKNLIILQSQYLICFKTFKNVIISIFNLEMSPCKIRISIVLVEIIFARFCYFYQRFPDKIKLYKIKNTWKSMCYSTTAAKQQVQKPPNCQRLRPATHFHLHNEHCFLRDQNESFFTKLLFKKRGRKKQKKASTS